MVAIPLPNGKTQFIDINGAPLVRGTVEHYVPGGLTPKDTWQDYGQTILNENPVPLDDRGQAVIFGSGQYRQIVKDSDGNQIWDEVTTALVQNVAETVMTFLGGPPTSSQWLGGEAPTQTINYPANFSGSRGTTPKTLPTSLFVVSIQKNGAAVGTATCDTSGNWVFATSAGAAVTISSADQIDFYAPESADATMANFGLTLAGAYTL